MTHGRQDVTVDANNPWPGLASFREQDREFFHGRDSAVADLHRLVERERVTLVFGLSGLGKTSLLQAGLFPRLRRDGFLPVSIRLDHASGVPLRAQTIDAVTIQARAHGVEAPGADASRTLWEHFHRNGADYWDRNRLIIPALVLDQFEEIFTHGRSTAARAAAAEAFLDELSELVEGRVPEAVKAWLEANPEDLGQFALRRHNYKVILSLREDFLPECEVLRQRLPVLAYSRFRVGRLNGAQALDVITRAGGRLVAEGVGERIVSFATGVTETRSLADAEVDPALLSVFCRELNNRRLAQNLPCITMDLLNGRSAQILEDFYDQCLADQPIAVRLFIEERLLTPGGARELVALDSALALPGV